MKKSWQGPPSAVLASAACQPESEGFNTDSALWAEMDQASHHPLSFPNIIPGQGLCNANVRSELDWVPLKAALDGSSHKTAGQGREHEKSREERIYVTTQS